jgi:hypothetical protein
MVGIHLHVSFMADLIQYEVGSWSHGYGCSSHFFWNSDIHAMLQKLAEYEHNVHLHRPGAQHALEDFKAQQSEIMTAICKVSSILPCLN